MIRKWPAENQMFFGTDRGRSEYIVNLKPGEISRPGSAKPYAPFFKRI